MIAAADLPLHEFRAVIDEPADRSIPEPGARCVFPGPGHHSLRSIHMCHMCSGRSRRCRRPSGVCKQVQYFDISSRFDGFLNNRREPVPVRRLLRKKSRVLERERLQMKRQRFFDGSRVLNGPLLRQIEEFPLSAAFAAAVIMCVRMLPRLSVTRLPDDLRVRPDQHILSPALELLAVRGVHHFIFLPSIGKIHFYPPSRQNPRMRFCRMRHLLVPAAPMLRSARPASAVVQTFLYRNLLSISSGTRRDLPVHPDV